MSKCDCMTIGLRSSIPKVAGFLIITLPTESSITSKLKDAPKSFIKAITRSSFLEGRGTAFKSANLFQTALGSNWRISVLIIDMVFCDTKVRITSHS